MITETHAQQLRKLIAQAGTIEEALLLIRYESGNDLPKSVITRSLNLESESDSMCVALIDNLYYGLERYRSDPHAYNAWLIRTRENDKKKVMDAIGRRR